MVWMVMAEYSDEYSKLISFRIDWLFSLQSKGLSRVFSNTTVQKHQFFSAQPSWWSSSYNCTCYWKNHSFNYMDLCLQSDICSNTLSRFVITFLPRSKGFLISRLQLPSAVIWEPKKIKSDIVSTVSPSICHEVMGPGAMIFVFWMLSFKPAFSLSSFTFIKRLFSPSSLSATQQSFFH